MTNLSLVQTEEMLDELQKRFDIFVIAGLRFTQKQGQRQEYSIIARFNPISFATLGFLETVKGHLEEKVLSSRGWKAGSNQDKI